MTEALRFLETRVIIYHSTHRKCSEDVKIHRHTLYLSDIKSVSKPTYTLTQYEVKSSVCVHIADNRIYTINKLI